ncbi:GNAT domain-containing protein [Apiospora arundinis]
MMSNANTNQVSVMNNYEDTVNKVTEMLNTNENQQADTMENSNKSPEPTPTKPARKNPLDAARCRSMPLDAQQPGPGSRSAAATYSC